MRLFSIILSVMIALATILSSPPATAFAAVDYGEIYDEMTDSYPELVDRMLNGEHPVTEDQILDFLEDLGGEVADSGVLTLFNFDKVMYDAMVEVLFEDGEIGVPVEKHYDIGMMLLSEFSEELSVFLEEGELTGDLEDLSKAVKAVILGGDAAAGGIGGGGLVTEEPKNGLVIELPEDGFDLSVEKFDGSSVAVAVINSGAVTELLDEAGSGATIIVNIEAAAEDAQAVLTASLLSKLAAKDATLVIKSKLGYYAISPGSVDPSQVASAIGGPVPSDIKVTIAITRTPAEDIGAAQAVNGSAEIVIQPINFDITCAFGNQTITVDRFSSFNERGISVPDGVDASLITTAVRLNENGGMQHIPTRLARDADGNDQVVFSSLTNSTYAVIHNVRQFEDTTGHWGRIDIEGMAARMIIGGVSGTAFEPDRDITRAEFMAIVVRSLGLMRLGAGKDSFTDVSAGSWYYDAVSIAKEYGVTSGNGDGTFAPDSRISREEAMTMIARASKLAGLDTTISEADKSAMLAKLQDSSELSVWAQASAASCIKNGIIVGDNGNIDPKDSITRAETAAIVKRMLTKAGLI